MGQGFELLHFYVAFLFTGSIKIYGIVKGQVVPLVR